MVEELENSEINIVDTIKLLIYKENSLLLEKVNFDDDEVFLQPLLFVYFNSKKDNSLPTEILEEIMQGFLLDKQEIKLNYSFNKKNIAYIPNLGYFNKEEKIPFEPIVKIENTTIEILKYPIKLLQPIFKTTSGNPIAEDEIVIDKQLFETNINALTNAFSFIKNNSTEHYKLIEQCCKACIMFKTNPDNTNSFATINAHGIAFFNVYQDDYDEVFFVDDIAHQTGHIILTTLFHERKKIFKIDENQNISKILKTKDYRDFYILFHALYTYYTTLICLDDCLKNNSFSSKQQIEAIGRIGFYLNKFNSDLNSFEKINTHYKGIENVITTIGIDLYNEIKRNYFKLYKKWDPTVSKLNFNNQTYNFSFSIFVKNNKYKL